VQHGRRHAQVAVGAWQFLQQQRVAFVGVAVLGEAGDFSAAGKHVSRRRESAAAIGFAASGVQRRRMVQEL
jgi:hypothetical protein